MLDFFFDLVNFIKFKKKERKYKFIFFCENPYTFEFLKKYIYKKQNTNKCATLTFFNLKDQFLKKENIIFLRTKIFKQIFFQTNKINFVYSSTPDLGYSLFLKSKLHKCKYIYIQHSPVSLTMIYKNKAFNNFDAVQTINKSQYREIQEINFFFKKKIKPFKSKYFLLEKNLPFKSTNKVLIAPTWGTNFFDDNIFFNIIKLIEKNNFKFVLRLHPETINKNTFFLKKLKDKGIILNNEPKIDLLDFSNLITDWSGIYFEFAFLKKIKPIVINTNKKINNVNYTQYRKLPLEIRARKIIAHEIELNNLSLISDKLKFKDDAEEKTNIEEFLKNEFYQ